MPPKNKKESESSVNLELENTELKEKVASLEKEKAEVAKNEASLEKEKAELEKEKAEVAKMKSEVASLKASLAKEKAEKLDPGSSGTALKGPKKAFKVLKSCKIDGRFYRPSTDPSNPSIVELHGKQAQLVERGILAKA